MADKIVVLQDGIVEQVGAPLELFDRPANTFVAGFIGSPSMNMLKGTVAAGKGSAVEVNGETLEIGGRHEAEAGQPVTFGIRPEHLELAEDGFPARITVVEPTGSETMVFLRFGESEIVALFRERHDFTPGETIHLKPRPNSVHLFHAETGKRL